MLLTSPAFQHNQKIPSDYTCDGSDINPELHISDVPPESKSLTLIMDDPDVPEFVRKDRLWVHWILFNIPPGTTKIEKNSSPPALCGINTKGALAYQGPCPPDREHRYFFKLYALDIRLNLPPGISKADLEKAMQGHILARAELIGLYKKISK
ncbi:MAG: YbhB/YbcL family Raf kinase inhibitor-like protein [Chlamydiales bacterium]|nr:YbhB/YbcL family Raf kinase inhibitor-like protein [Chlamydiales bacterium]